MKGIKQWLVNAEIKIMVIVGYVKLISRLVNPAILGLALNGAGAIITHRTEGYATSVTVIIPKY